MVALVSFTILPTAPIIGPVGFNVLPFCPRATNSPASVGIRLHLYCAFRRHDRRRWEPLTEVLDPIFSLLRFPVLFWLILASAIVRQFPPNPPRLYFPIQTTRQAGRWGDGAQSPWATSQPKLQPPVLFWLILASANFRQPPMAAASTYIAQLRRHDRWRGMRAEVSGPFLS